MKRNTKGFTLAEMLIVVAIIGILVAVLIATISNIMEKSREAVDLSDLRTAYAQMVNVVDGGDKIDRTVMYTNGKGKSMYYVMWVEPTQKKNGWQSTNIPKDENGRIIIGDSHVAAPVVESNRVYKLLYYVCEQPAKDATNPEPYRFRIETYSRSEFESKKVKFYNR